MKMQMYLAAAALAGMTAASGASAQDMTTVQCGGVNVIMTEEQVATVKAATGEQEFGAKVCEAAKKIDVSSFTEPTPVTVTMSNGASYELSLQAAP